MHQNQWLAAIEELKADGLGRDAGPERVPAGAEYADVAYQFWNVSDGDESEAGRWASGPSPDGKGEFQYLARPGAAGRGDPELNEAEPLALGTAKKMRIRPPGRRRPRRRVMRAAD